MGRFEGVLLLMICFSIVRVQVIVGETAAKCVVDMSSGFSNPDQGMACAMQVCLRPQTCKPACCAEAVRESDERDLQPHAQHLLPQFFKLEVVEEVAAAD